MYCNTTKLEIWGRTQREAARAVSPTGETIYGVEIPLLVTSRGPNAIACYTARAVVIMGGSKFTKYFCQRRMNC